MVRKWLVVAVVGVSVATGAGCGGDDDEGGDATSAAAPAATSAADTGAATDAATTGETTETAAAVDLGGKTVRISGSETGVEGTAINESFKGFEERTGADVNFSGSRDFETQISLAIQSGKTPDIAFFPQPGKMQDAAASIPGLPEDIIASVAENYDPGWTDVVTTKDGKLLGVPIKADLKSLVWYNPTQFEEGGYEVPKTWDELIALQDKIKADGKTPWCIGVESGDATGWTFTDWMEDFMLRMQGPEVYDQWVKHEIPFNDPKVKEVAQAVADIWFAEGNVLQSREEIATTSFGDAGIPLLDGDCLLHRQANFYAGFLQENEGEIGEDKDAFAFYLPSMEEGTNPVLSAGLYAVAFNDKPETLETMRFLASPEYVTARVEAQKGGFLSANKKQDVSVYPNDLERTFAEILAAGDPVRFDASDLMPAEVGTGTFWSGMVDYISGEDLEAVLTEIEESWPSE